MNKDYSFEDCCHDFHKYGHATDEFISRPYTRSSNRSFNAQCYTCIKYAHKPKECKYKMKNPKACFNQ